MNFSVLSRGKNINYLRDCILDDVVNLIFVKGFLIPCSLKFGKIEIKVLGERSNIHTERGINSDADISAVDAEGIILMSVASCSLQSGTKKIYRRSLAYIADDKPEIICFMNDL